MIGRRGVELGLKMERLDRTRARRWDKEGQDIIADFMADTAKEASGVDDPPGATKEDPASIALIGEGTNGFKNYWIALGAIDAAKKHLVDIMIRRTGSSKRPDGQPVLGLEPFVESVVYILPREFEKELMETEMEEEADADGVVDDEKRYVPNASFCPV